MKVISVVRDFGMYDRLVRNNPFYPKGTDFVAFDNNKENKTIPERYNSFLDKYNYANDDWFIFCHEDWEVQEDLRKKLKNLDVNYLYGPIGMPLNYGLVFSRTPTGQIYNSNKDGGLKKIIGTYNANFPEVGTFDCQSLIVHSSLIKKHHLRFDENLSFDLYIEDFCINARENYNISSKVIQLKCQHYSFGKIQERFYKQYKYLQKKYEKSKSAYITTCSNQIIGNKLFNLCLFFQMDSHFFYRKKVTKSGKLIIKICKIPVYRRKV